MKRDCRNKVEIAEDYCFICKDGGLLLVCDFKHCLKAYHPECVGKDANLLEEDPWTCSWHSCFICHRRSKFQCFCCPYSVCGTCTSVALFVHVKRGKGFCRNCLRLALLLEENLDVDSDGGKVDFNDSETYEFLFRGYWDSIKQHESLSLKDLHTADARLKRGKQDEDGSDSDNLPEDQKDLTFSIGKMNQQSNDEFLAMKNFTGQDIWMKIGRKKYTPRKKEFIGWGSKNLLLFLKSIGKSIDEPISHAEVYDIVTDYINENGLRHPQRKKKVICDDPLHSLLGRKSINRNKISALLESHFAENQRSEDESLDESLDGLEDATIAVACKRQRRSISSGKATRSVSIELHEKVLEAHKNRFAAITTKNIKLVYLQRSLIEEFLKISETFETKVVDCFVRVKSDPNGYYLPKTHFQLVQITGIKRAPEAYKTGEISTDIILKVSNMIKDIRISMVSDDDFSEEECEDLRYRIKEGHLKRPTVVVRLSSRSHVELDTGTHSKGELDKKARSLHEEMTNHWIDREILLLQNRIDRANEKGWRRELFEYIERKELLQTPSERLRLLKELPKVGADEEIELEGSANSPADAHRVNEGNEAPNQMDPQGSSILMDPKRESEGNGAASEQKAIMRGLQGSRASSRSAAEREVEGNETMSPQQARKTETIDSAGNRALSPRQAGKTGTAESISSIYSFFFGNGAASREKVIEREPKETGASSVIPRQIDFGDVDVVNGKAVKREDEGIGATSIASEQQQDTEEQQHQHSEEKDVMRDVIELDEEEDPNSADVIKHKNSSITVIDIDDDDDDDGDPPADRKQESMSGEGHKIWHYMDPNGQVQGPFAISALKSWKEAGYFDPQFKVWKTGQSQEDWILLTDVIGIASKTVVQRM